MHELTIFQARLPQAYKQDCLKPSSKTAPSLQARLPQAFKQDCPKPSIKKQTMNNDYKIISPGQGSFQVRAIS